MTLGLRCRFPHNLLGGRARQGTSAKRRSSNTTTRNNNNNNKESGKATANDSPPSTTAAAGAATATGFLAGVLTWYSKCLDTRPILTKCISSGIIAAAGDVACQKLFHADDDVWDPAATMRFAILGTGLVAPVIHVWYGVLSRHVPGITVAAVAKRVALDQFVFSPIFIPVWITSLWTLEGKPVNGQTTKSLLLDTLPKVVVTNWILWIPAQVINFRFVPVKYQVLVNNLVGFIWNMYLSYSTSKTTTTTTKTAASAETQSKDKEQKTD